MKNETVAAVTLPEGTFNGNCSDCVYADRSDWRDGAVYCLCEKAGHMVTIARATATAAHIMRSADGKGRMDMWLSIIMIALLVWGTWLSWKDIEQGTGWVCGFFSAKMLKSLNDKKNLWKKILLAVVLGYITVVLKVTKWIILFVMHMVDGSLFR